MGTDRLGHGLDNSSSYLRHRELRGCADARLLAEVQEGLHPTGAVVALGVDCGHVVVARLEDEVYHDPGLGGGHCQYCHVYFLALSGAQEELIFGRYARA